MNDQNQNQSWLSARWIGDATTGCLRLIDQTELPTRRLELDITHISAVWEAIRTLRVRGAPAIGVAAAYGVVLGARESDFGRSHEPTPTDILDAALRASAYLRTSRPTAVNLFWALDRMDQTARAAFAANQDLIQQLWAEAQAIRDEDELMCQSIGMHGASLIESGQGILTHCNAGALATSNHGTALAAIYHAHESGKTIRVYADETRPLLQGARLTAWELQSRGVPVTLICDNMAAQVMREGKIQMVIVGADRIASNGDTANKIGTYGVAVLARAHNIPFYVAAPSSTFDFAIPNGDSIPIEHRDPMEITRIGERMIAPAGVETYNPAFDVTPASLITGIVTERGVIRPVQPETIRACLG